MSTQTITSDYAFESAAALHTASYLTEPLIAICRELSARRILDLGCGNGALCGALAAAGFEVIGCDPSEEGISFARKSFPNLTFHKLGVYDDPSILGGSKFDVVLSTEVIEHLFLPRALPQFATQVLRPGGTLIITTPYHGYLKNLLIALFNKCDAHFTALWDGGHVKFWSRTTLTQLLREEQFSVTRFLGVGRIPYLWKSMIVVAQIQCIGQKVL